MAPPRPPSPPPPRPPIPRLDLSVTEEKLHAMPECAFEEERILHRRFKLFSASDARSTITKLGGEGLAFIFSKGRKSPESALLFRVFETAMRLRV